MSRAKHLTRKELKNKVREELRQKEELQENWNADVLNVVVNSKSNGTTNKSFRNYIGNVRSYIMLLMN